MKEVTMRQVGGSIGTTLPKDMLDHFHIKAGDIPSENPTSYSQYVNVGAAQRMGLQLPLAFFQSARVWVGSD